MALPNGALPAEVVPVEGCAGRVLACRVAARLDLPGFDQSAMDGYAICSAGIMPGTAVPVTGRTAAGEAPGQITAGGRTGS
ncbi:MAG TPA: hypothetical protein VE690_19455 [Rhodopila sp.]|nr:hypothetical protein [Rhodopila sp.]